MYYNYLRNTIEDIVVKMKTIFFHFLFIHIFVNSIASRKNNILQNINIFNKILSTDRYSTNGKYNPDIDLDTVSVNVFVFLYFFFFILKKFIIFYKFHFPL